MQRQRSETRKVITMGIGAGLLPPTRAEIALMNSSPGEAEPIWFGDRAKSFPGMAESSPGGQLILAIQEAYGLADNQTSAEEVVRLSRELIAMHPLHIVGHLYEELGMNASPNYNEDACIAKIDEIVTMVDGLLSGAIEWSGLPPTLRPVTREHLMHERDRVLVNKCHRLLSKNSGLEEIPELIRNSFSTPQDAPATQRRLAVLSETLYRLGRIEESNQMIRRAVQLNPMDWEAILEGLCTSCPSIRRTDWR